MAINTINQILPYVLKMAIMKRRTPRSVRRAPPGSVREGTASYSVPEVEIVTIDRSGRLVLPKKIRDNFNTDRFEVRSTADAIELVPVKPLRSLLGALPDLDIRRIYREHDEDVDREDE